MKRFRKFFIFVIIIELLVIAISNIIYINQSKNNEPQIEREQENGQIVYRVTYNRENDDSYLILINSSLGIMVIVSIITGMYISTRIIKPFSDIKEMPFEIAKGNLSIPIKEQKNKYLGKFTWGMDMLRENIENNKKRELKYQKEKKTLILSLSHDIKTPLSAIKLYARALKDNLYDSEEKKLEAVEGISKNTIEIERFVNEIVKNSREDFMDLPVKISDFYLKDVIYEIKSYYKDKLEPLKIDFKVNEFENCILKGDKDRVIEVLQNIIENAIKYGDGNNIEIKFSEEEDCKLVSILNSGCELKEEDLPHIFDSFYRGSNSKKKEGSGLGLYICKQLMHKMDGDIFAKIKDNTNFEVTVVLRKD